MVIFRCFKYTAIYVVIIYYISAMYNLILFLEHDNKSLFYIYLYELIRIATEFEKLLGFTFLATKLVTGLTLYGSAEGKFSNFAVPVSLVVVSCCRQFTQTKPNLNYTPFRSTCLFCTSYS